MDELASKSDTLSNATIDLVDFVLTDGKALRMPDLDVPDVTHLVRYLCGALAMDALPQLERGLLAQSSARRRLRLTRSALAEIQCMDWSRVARDAQIMSDSDDIKPEVARAWLQLVTGRIASQSQMHGRWRQEGWVAIRRETMRGIAEAQAAWTAFLAFAEAWKASLSRMALTPALQRGRGEGNISSFGSMNAGMAITQVECEVNSDGVLNVVAWVAPANRGQTASAEVETLLLSLRRDDDLLPLATGTRIEDRVEWSLPGFGAALQLPPGPLPSQFFAFDSVTEPEIAGETSRSLPAEVMDATGQPVIGALAYIEMVSAARWEQGQFTVTISIPTFIHLAYSAYTLELSLFITAQFRQVLGRWPVKEWEDAPRVLTAPCPGVADVTLSTAWILQARLVPS